MPSVLLVDDHLLIRLGLRQMLSEEIRGLVFGEAQNGNEVATKLRKKTWDLVILAINIHGEDRFSVLQEIRRLHPATPVLVLSMYTEAQYALQAKLLGAAGFVSKTAGRAELLRAFKAVLSGSKFFDSLPPPGAHETPPHAGLSTREYEVLLAFAAGKRSTEIAAELNLSAKTIGTYKHRMVEKLGVRSTVDLVRYAINHRLS
jgi:two-component system invasion response regulator UvrY